MADAFKSFGLEPAGDDGTFFQRFEFTAGVALGDGNRLKITGSKAAGEPTVDKDWRPISFSTNGAVDPSGIVFAGYGIELPAGAAGGDGGGDTELYSSYFHLDVKGKWVMVLRYSPQDLERP